MVTELDLTDTYEYPDSSITIKYDSLGLLKCGTAASVWDSSLVLAKLLEIGMEKNAELKRIKSLGKKAKIIELGSGVGLVAKVLSTVAPDSTIVATDLAATLPLLQLNTRYESNVDVRELKWGCIDQIERIFEEYEMFHLILLSDLITWPDLYEALVETLDRLLGKDSVAIFVHECRSFEKEAKFFAMLQEKKIRFKMIESKDQHPQYQSEDIYVFSLSRP